MPKKRKKSIGRQSSNSQIKKIKRTQDKDENIKSNNKAKLGKPFYKCSQCDTELKNKRNFESHMKIHNDEKPFVCCICNKSFFRKDKMDYHIQAHHENKLFKCSHCDTEFLESHSWNVI